MKPEHILADHSPQVRALANQLRRLIRKTVPDAAEVAYPVWHGIGYRHPEAGYFCGIFPHKDGVKIYFEYGTLLPDPGGILEGQSLKKTRYINMKSIKDISNGPLKKLLRAAICHPRLKSNATLIR